MRELPILMMRDMVCTTLDGRKGVTRRVMDPQPEWLEEFQRWRWIGSRCKASWGPECGNPDGLIPGCPYGAPGARLWVRETWRADPQWDHLPPRAIPPGAPISYEATCPAPTFGGKVRPSIFMPRWASRILLENTGVRVERVRDLERLPDLGEAEVLAEGLVRQDDHVGPYFGLPGRMTNRTAYAAFARLWDGINAARGFPYRADPHVWVVNFRVLEICGRPVPARELVGTRA